MSGCLARPLLDSLLRQHLHEVHIRFIHVHIYVFGDRKEIVICCAGSREKKLCVWGRLVNRFALTKVDPQI